MIKREVREEILNQWLDNKSMREISRSLGIHRNTVKKAIDEFQVIVNKMGFQSEIEIKSHIDEIVGTKRYRREKQPSKINQEVKDRVEKLMWEKEWKKGSKRKNSKNITTIYFELTKGSKEDGGGGEELGYTTVCKIVKELEAEGVVWDDD
ncbi:MAG: hypothetical protein PHT78_11040 [Desulfitobacteriaceae bacterium]|nr:hypothetical protein [Desulfitobacteriaceae bacterium]MDD4753759.1 hypothetical protein [Desulfitobacteriaceae bacterium]